MRKKLLLKVMGFLLIIGLIYCIISELSVVTSVSDTMHISGFYLEPKNSLDVVMVGPSELYTGFCSPLAWKKYGFTSYAMTFSGVSVSLYKSMLKEALKEQHPKLVVFEINGIIQTDEYMDKESKKSIWLNNIPWSENKIDTINSRVSEDKQFSYYNKLLRYHFYWSHPYTSVRSFIYKAKMKAHGVSYTKSFSTRTWERDDDSLKEYTIKFTEKAEAYLRELLDYCKEQGLENVLFARFPHCLKAKNPEKLQEMIKLIHEYGYDFVNLENSFEKIGLDKKQDFYNENHLNIFGMEKFTEYFGKYLWDNYEIKGEHSEESIKQWDECYDKVDNIIKDCKGKVEKGIHKHIFENAAYN